MEIAIGSDHRGFALKARLIAELGGQGHRVADLGPFDAESCDYPDFAYAVARHVASGRAVRGIVICSNGVGVTMARSRDNPLFPAKNRLTPYANTARQFAVADAGARHVFA